MISEGEKVKITGGRVKEIVGKIGWVGNYGPAPESIYGRDKITVQVMVKGVSYLLEPKDIEEIRGSGDAA